MSALYVPTDAQPHEAPPGEPRVWPSIDAWQADPGHYWYPEPRIREATGSVARVKAKAVSHV